MSTVTPTILSQGKAMDPAYALLSLDVRREVGRIPRADLVLVDGEVARRKFAISDTAFFEPGKEIEIKLRWEGEGKGDQRVFKGVVVRHGVEATEDGSLLAVEIKDSAEPQWRLAERQPYNAFVVTGGGALTLPLSVRLTDVVGNTVTATDLVTDLNDGSLFDVAEQFPACAVFEDGFESGKLSAWSQSAP